MPITTVTGPDGQEYDITHPEGASDEEIINYARQNYGGAAAPRPSRPLASAAPRTMQAAPGVAAQQEAAEMAGGILPERQAPVSGPLGPGAEPVSFKQYVQNVPSALPMIGSMVGGAAGSVVPGLGTMAGGAIGGGIGAGAGEFARQMVSGEDVNLGRIGREAAISAAIPPAMKYVASPVVRVLSRYFPGAPAALQNKAVSDLRRAAQGIPRPPMVTAAERAAGRQAETQASEAAYQQTLAQATEREATESAAQVASNVRAARNVPELLPTVKGNPYDALKSLEMLGGEPQAIPLTNLASRAAELKSQLSQIIPKWKLDPDAGVREAANQLDDFLTTTPNLNPLQLKQAMRDMWPAIERGFKSGGEPMLPGSAAVLQLRQAAHKDLAEAAAAGDTWSATLLQADKDYMRQLAQRSLRYMVGQGMSYPGGVETFAPGAASRLLKTLKEPAGTAARRISRLRMAATPEELAQIEEAAGQLARPRPKFVPPERPAAPAGAPSAERIPSLQSRIERNIAKIREGGRLEQANAGEIMRDLPQAGRLEESKLAQWLEQNVPPEKLAEVQKVLGRIARLPSATGGMANFLERFPIYAMLGGFGYNLAGGGPGFLISGVAAEALRNLIKTPLGARMIERLTAANLGRGVGTRALQTLAPTAAEAVRGGGRTEKKPTKPR